LREYLEDAVWPLVYERSKKVEKAIRKAYEKCSGKIENSYYYNPELSAPITAAKMVEERVKAYIEDLKQMEKKDPHFFHNVALKSPEEIDETGEWRKKWKIRTETESRNEQELVLDLRFRSKCISPEQLIVIFQKLIFLDLHYVRPERNIIAP